jgi:hypothetical protein
MGGLKNDNLLREFDRDEYAVLVAVITNESSGVADVQNNSSDDGVMHTCCFIGSQFKRMPNSLIPSQLHVAVLVNPAKFFNVLQSLSSRLGE